MGRYRILRRVEVRSMDEWSLSEWAHSNAQALGFEEPPALILAEAAQGREAVLVIDQLDAVSTTSGRATSFLEAVACLLIEARGLGDRLRLHVVVACREFDLAFRTWLRGGAWKGKENSGSETILGAPQKLTTSTRIVLTTPKTDRATWHGDGRYLPHPRRRRVIR